eukprot:CAMPEP_0198116388 /NCGR_PEP_ID=MMETSP1442-20131203/11902_1 /TAXON_ID= /ORGANISM="Craspedostauros australis, Strain CCMP3328" /LENGTH=92 /DNA_ID=CAMNT_0043774185 /DNA_START=114 /DNA_END=393 /DNA_ORIENTATION=-
MADFVSLVVGKTNSFCPTSVGECHSQERGGVDRKDVGLEWFRPKTMGVLPTKALSSVHERFAIHCANHNGGADEDEDENDDDDDVDRLGDQM